MAEILACPACGRKLQVPESFYGQTVQCPQCAHQFIADPHAQNVQANAPAPVPATTGPTPPPDDHDDYDDAPRRRRRDYDDDDDDILDDVRPMRRQGAPHRGGMILALGIIALVIFPWSTIVCGPLAWVLGNFDLAEIRAGRMDESGEGMVQAGRVLGIVSTLLMLGTVLLVCLFIAMVSMAGRG